MGHRQIRSVWFECHLNSFFPLWIMIRPTIALDVLPLHNQICLSHRCIWSVPPGLCQVLLWTWLWCSTISSVQSYWTQTWWPRTCLSKRDKCLFHDYRERLKLLRAYITSQEVVQHKAAIPTKPSPRFSRSSRSLSSAQKYLTCSYSTLHLPSLSTLHPIGMLCISGVVTLVASSVVLCLPLSLLTETMCSIVQRGWVRPIPHFAV